MTERIRDFLRDRRERGVDEGPVLVVDLDVVRDNYTTFAKALPDTRVFYAVKATGAGGACAAGQAWLLLRHASVPRSRWRWRLALRRTVFRSATPSRRSVTLRAPSSWAFACSRSTARPKSRRSPVRRPARASSAASSPTASGRSGRCRASSVASRHGRRCAGARARQGLEPYGVSFHVGSQQRNQHAGTVPRFGGGGVPGVRRAWHQLSMVNLGGGSRPST